MDTADKDVSESVPSLIDALSRKDWRARKEAVESLVRRGDPAALEALVRSLRHEHRNPSLLNSALQVLALMKLDIVTPLVELLSDSDAEVRTYAALALGLVQDAGAVPALVRALDDPDTNVRYHAIEALGLLHAEEAVDKLCSVAESGDFFLAFPSLDALRRIGHSRAAPRLLPFLHDPLLRDAAIETLGHLGDASIAGALAALMNTPEAPVVQVARALCDLHDRYERLYEEGSHIADLVRHSIEDTGVSQVVDSLKHASPHELRFLVVVLGWLEGPAVEQALVQLLGNASVRKETIAALVRYGNRVTDLLIENIFADDYETRKAAAIALGRIGDSRAVPALAGVLSRDEELMLVASGALAKIGDRRAFEPLLDLLSHKDAVVRQAAISALNSIGHPEMPCTIAGLLAEADPHTRESAVKIAGYFGYPECMDLLFERCHDEHEGVRSAAVEHIAYLEDERVLPTVSEALRGEAPRVRAAAARGLAYVDRDAALPLLLEALEDRDSWVKYFAVRSLGRHGYAEALEALIRLTREDTVPYVRIAAIEALGRTGDPRAIAPLSQWIEAEDRDLSRASLEALGRIQHPDALPPLLKALHSPNPALKNDAIRALTERGGTDALAALQWIASEAEPLAAEKAIQGLSQLGTSESVQALLHLAAISSHRELCVHVLSRLGEAWIETIAEGLTHEQPKIRGAAVAALGRMKHSKATQQMIRALDDPDPVVRLASVNALEHLGSLLGKARLSELAHADPDPKVRQEAQRLLQTR